MSLRHQEKLLENIKLLVLKEEMLLKNRSILGLLVISIISVCIFEIVYYKTQYTSKEYESEEYYHRNI